MSDVESACVEARVEPVASVALSIFRTHTARLGLARTATGGGLMYLTLPFFIFVHLTLTRFLYQLLLRPLCGLPSLRARDYIILDRYHLAGLGFFDRCNCLFCEYANGIITLMNAELDLLAVATGRRSLAVRLLLALALVPLTLLTAVGILLVTLPSNVLMQLLGLHRGSHHRIARRLQAEGYASGYPRLGRRVILMYKVIAEVVAYNLEQIESAWCPIKHLQRAGYVFPPHHANFLVREDLPAMQAVLASKGTVSGKAPKF